eukprot:3000792-Amphidinium_carterae.1
MSTNRSARTDFEVAILPTAELGNRTTTAGTTNALANARNTLVDSQTWQPGPAQASKTNQILL